MNRYELYKVVERLGEVMKVSTRQVGAEYGLQPVQIEVLHYLASCNRFSDNLMAVVDYLGQTKGTISQTVKVLEQKGLVEKIQDDIDKRASHLVITQAGREFIDEKLIDAHFDFAFEQLSKDQQALLSSALSSFTRSLMQSSGLNTFGVCQTCKFHDQHQGQYYCNLLQTPLYESDIDKVCKEHTAPDASV